MNRAACRSFESFFATSASPTPVQSARLTHRRPRQGRLVPKGVVSRRCRIQTVQPDAEIVDSGKDCGMALGRLDEALKRTLWSFELAGFALLLVVFNAPLFLGGSFSTQFIFHPKAVEAGEWWRLLSHPWVHVSWYHLALDATAFFLAYLELKERHFPERLGILAGAMIGSLGVALLASPLIETYGLCGLSGVAHGLTAVVSLEMMRRTEDRWSRWLGGLCLVGVVAKGVAELASGHVLLEACYRGALGTPVAACHAGGILGALLVWLGMQMFRSDKPV